MAVRDMATHFDALFAGLLALDGNETNAGAIIDTAHFDGGITFLAGLTAWTDGTHTLLLEESDAANMAGSNVVPAAKRVNDVALPVFGAALTAGAALTRVGLHSTKRYVRASYVSAGVTTGATGFLAAIRGAEILPAA